MAARTFVEKILGASAGNIVFKKPDLVLSHDNTASIESTFRKMGGSKVFDPDQLMVVLDHNAPPTNSKLANDYQQIRNFVQAQGIMKFHDVGNGICHQLMSLYAQPSMIIAGSDSHTCTAGAFNAFATGIDRTETAGLWMQGETWFRVPESIKISLLGHLNEGVFAKDLALYVMGMIGSNGADYLSIEYHGEGVKTLTLADRMTIANLASEMGAKNAVFPYDEVLSDFYRGSHKDSGKHIEADSQWADEGAKYYREIEINLSEVFPLIACPHYVDQVKYVDEIAGTPIGQALIGTCTNGRIEDLRIAASILKGNKVSGAVQLLITPASREIYLQAVKEGLAEIFLSAGANILTPSCGPCLGTGQGIPADHINVISTANRNFLGRMGNPKAFIFLASPATVALSAIHGKIVSPAPKAAPGAFPYHMEQSAVTTVSGNRREQNVWNYSDADDLNTDQMFAGKLTYEISSSQADKIAPYLLQDFDSHFVEQVRKGDIIVAGENFGCGSSREHPAVGFKYVGIQYIIVKSVSRIFYRSAINQGLPVLVVPEAVVAYRQGDHLKADMEKGIIYINDREFYFNPLPGKLRRILEAGGLLEEIRAPKA